MSGPDGSGAHRAFEGSARTGSRGPCGGPGAGLRELMAWPSASRASWRSLTALGAQPTTRRENRLKKPPFGRDTTGLDLGLTYCRRESESRRCCRGPGRRRLGYAILPFMSGAPLPSASESHVTPLPAADRSPPESPSMQARSPRSDPSIEGHRWSQWLTYPQAAAYCGRKVTYARNLVSAGQIPVYGRPRCAGSAATC